MFQISLEVYCTQHQAPQRSSSEEKTGEQTPESHLGKLIHLPVPSGTTTLFKVFLREVNSPGFISVLLSTKFSLLILPPWKMEESIYFFPFTGFLPYGYMEFATYRDRITVVLT